MTQAKVFHLKGKTIKTVKAHAYTKPDGTTGYTDNWRIADAFNKRFTPVVLPARETPEGAA